MNLQDFAYLGNSITETASTNTSLQRDIYSEAGGFVATLTAEPFNGVAEIDFSAILRSLINDIRLLMSDCRCTYKDYNLQVIALIGGTKYTFVRGVHQLAPTTAATWKFLTNMPVLRHYAGYPLSISHVVSNTNRTYWSVQINGEHMESNSGLMALASTLKLHATTDLTTNPNTETMTSAIYTHGDEYPYLDDQSGDEDYPYRWGTPSLYFMTENRNPQVNDPMYSIHGASWWVEQIDTEQVNKPMAGVLSIINDGTQRDSIQIIETPVPVHPIYIRWVNDLGGWDYFMFACNNKRAMQLTANDAFERYGSNGVRTTYNKAATSTIEVSSGVIDRQTLESLSKMIFSPFIQIYSESEWTEIQIKDGKPEIKADQTTGEMLITFELPTPQMNK